jgi:twitching motility two-component system response regulator PilH
MAVYCDVPWKHRYPTIVDMVAGKIEGSALGAASSRFLESIPRKVAELETCLEDLSRDLVEAEARSALHRKLHALYASVLVFRHGPLMAVLEEGIAILDSAMERGAGMAQTDVDGLRHCLGKLSAQVTVRQSMVPSRLDTPMPRPLESDLPDGGPLRVGSLRELELNTTSLPFVVARPVPRTRHDADPAPPPPQSGVRPAQTDSIDGSLLTRTLHVLVLARDDRSALRDMLLESPLRFDLFSEADALMECAREETPDAVLADAELAHSVHLAAQLRGDPGTDHLPIVLHRSSAELPLTLDTLRRHVDAVLTAPVDVAELTRVMGRVTGTLIEAEVANDTSDVRTLSLEELAHQVAESVRRGIMQGAVVAPGTRFSMDGDSALRAAALATVASVRAFVESRSEGKVHFDERLGGAHPGLLQTAGELRDPQGELDFSPLKGRRVLVADDDTGVVMLLCSIFREQDATVVEATDGNEALASARTERPDLIITDVVMPGRDGLSLCRELSRDPLLADVPVLLIPSKEELLLCVRDSASFAPNAVRRDMLARRILAQAVRALAPRVMLEEELRGEGEVRGSLDATGVVALLRSVRRIRPDARITLRDAWNAFEVLLHEGRITRLTRTASDGSFVRGECVLPQLLGITHGRFSIEALTVRAKASSLGTLEEALLQGAEELTVQLDAVSMPRLMVVGRVTFDEDAVQGLMRQGNESLVRVVQQLHRGVSASDIEPLTGVPQPVIEALLRDLTRRGAIRAVASEGGTDLLAALREERLAQRDFTPPRSRIPPPPTPIISLLPPAPTEDDASILELPVAKEAAVWMGNAESVTMPTLRTAERAPRLWVWAVGLVALLALGFVLGREGRPETPRPISLPAAPKAGAAPFVDPETLASHPAPDKDAPALVAPPPAPPPAPEPSAPAEPPAAYREEAGTPQGLALSPGQGVVVLEAARDSDALRVRIDDRLLVEKLPATVPLAQGIHELAVQRGDGVRYRFVTVRSGYTHTFGAL